MNDVGELIKSARLQIRITQAQLANLAGTSQPTVARLESGRASPTLKTVNKLLTVMGRKLTLGTRSIDPSETGIDTSLIEENLRLSPRERLDRAAAYANFVRSARDSSG